MEQNRQKLPLMLDPRMQRPIAVFVARALAAHTGTTFPPDLQEELAKIDALPDDQWREFERAAYATFGLMSLQLFLATPPDVKLGKVEPAVAAFLSAFTAVGLRGEEYAQEVGENVQ